MFELAGATAPGRYVITASVPAGSDSPPATTTLDVVVVGLRHALHAPVPESDTSLEGETLTGKGGLLGASIGLPDGANKPNEGSYLWSVEPFDASIACGDMDVPAGYIRSVPRSRSEKSSCAQREIPLSIPAEPRARSIPSARQRHVRVLYSGPRFREPRVVPIARSPLRRSSADAGRSPSRRRASAPTEPSSVKDDAGPNTRTADHHPPRRDRRLDGRHGLEHVRPAPSRSFDVIAPLGGPASWAWLMHYIETQPHRGLPRPSRRAPTLDRDPAHADRVQTTTRQRNRARPASGQEPTTLRRTPAHADPDARGEPVRAPPGPSTTGGAEYPRAGHRRTASRGARTHLPADLALLMGNPNGDNFSPERAEPARPASDPTTQRLGVTRTGQCAVWVDLHRRPTRTTSRSRSPRPQQRLVPRSAALHTLTLTTTSTTSTTPTAPSRSSPSATGLPHTDGRGRQPVVERVEGRRHQQATRSRSAWPSTTTPTACTRRASSRSSGSGPRAIGATSGPDGGEQRRGARSTMARRERGSRRATTTTRSTTPVGTERQPPLPRWASPSTTSGSTASAGTPQQPPRRLGTALGDGYDVGEGDGVFTASRGLHPRMWGRHDPAASRSRSDHRRAGATWTTRPSARLDNLWTDGGTCRDIFTIPVLLAASFRARSSSSGRTRHPSTTPTFSADARLRSGGSRTTYTPAIMPWEDVPRIGPACDTGKIDPTSESTIESGNGQHVGTVNQITWRLHVKAPSTSSARWKLPSSARVVKNSNDDAEPRAPHLRDRRQLHLRLHRLARSNRPGDDQPAARLRPRRSERPSLPRFIYHACTATVRRPRT